MGTTVAPGFEFEDLVFGKREELLRSFPAAKADIEKLT
jgi:predicted cupin superfamily sugar epimerase